MTRDCGMMGLRAEMKEKERTKGRGVHLTHHIALIQLESLQRQKRCSLQFRVREASKGKVALRRKIWKMNSRLFSSHLNVNSLFNCGAIDHRIISELDNLDMTFSWNLRPYQGRCGVGRTSISCAPWSRTARHLCIIIIIRFYGGDI